MKAIVAAGVMTAVGLSIQPALSASIGQFTSKEGREVVTLSGEIASGDTDRVVAAIKTANDAGRVVSGIRLNSPGGALSEGVKLAGAIRFGNIATVVMNGTTCASACFIAFAAGSEKFASYTAQVGVHGASTDGVDDNDAKAATIIMAKVIKELGVPSGIIGKMVVTAPDQIVWLTSADLQTMGVTMTGKPSQVASTPAQVSAAQPAQAAPQTATPTSLANAPVSKDALWNQVLDYATKRSAAQNNGTPKFLRSCQPELKLCNSVILFRDDNGKDTMVRRATDADDRMVSRDVCTFNGFGDVRECIDIDSKTQTKEMKDASGHWSSIAN